jgi:predicted nucleic acid-binding protein
VARALTIDASVFVSALSPLETKGQESLRLIDALRDTPRLVILPTLVRPEIAGAVNRLTGDQDLAREAAGMEFLPTSTLYVTLDQKLAEEAAELAVGAGLRGADAVYAATARRFDAVLVTLDSEQRNRLPSDIAALWPWEVDLT